MLAEHTPRRDAVRGLVRELARAAGTGGMVGGEIADILAEGQEPARETVEFIHERKTAALFRASVVMGAHAAEAPQALCLALAEYGTALGLAFQIVDDMLDETGDAAQLGKSPGKDRAAKKMSYVAAAGLDESRERARQYTEKGLSALAAVPNSETLAGLLEFAVTRVN